MNVFLPSIDPMDSTIKGICSLARWSRYETRYSFPVSFIVLSLPMQRVVIDIPDNKFKFFMELVNNLGFKKVRRLTPEQREFVEDLQNSLEEVNLLQEGKLEKQSAEDFLNEL